MFCSQCGSQIADQSTACGKCGWRIGSSVSAVPVQPQNWVSPYDVNTPLRPLPAASSELDFALKVLAPVGRSLSAIAAGYLGIFSVLVLPAPFAILMGILGLREIKKNPKLGGRGRAIFGIAMGILGLFIPMLLILIAAVG